MNNILVRTLILVTVFALGLSLVAPADCFAAMANIRPSSGEQVQPAKTSGYVSAAENPLAITKEGFFVGKLKGRIVIQQTGTYREVSYLPTENMVVTHNEEEIELRNLLVHSIVKLVLIDGMVAEIILIEESS